MIIAATPSIKASYDARKFANVNIIYNYPYQQELMSSQLPEDSTRSNTFIYVGGITEIRGITNLVNALDLANAKESIKLVLAGPIFPSSYKKELEALTGWKHVEYLGPISRSTMALEFSKAMCGLCNFLPLKNHVEAMPNKIFEYMSAGLPILCSDFDLWRKLVIENNVGYVCDPEDIQSIATALVMISNLDPKELEEKGKTGIELIQTKYSWENEEKELLKLYKSLI
jgi:glycosyltransferase involved in cell wall biosynthesis